MNIYILFYVIEIINSLEKEDYVNWKVVKWVYM